MVEKFKVGRLWPIVLAMTAMLAGCATSDTVRKAPIETGISHSFAGSYDHTAAATMKALSSLNINITSSEVQPVGTVIFVSKPISAFSWGEVGRVIVKKSDAAPTTVVVNWEKRDQLQITGTDSAEFTNVLFSTIDKLL